MIDNIDMWQIQVVSVKKKSEMVLVNISSLAGTISLKMHILIVSNESRLKRDGIDRVASDP